MSKNLFLSICLGICSLPAMAQNPIVQTMYTADPAPLVHNDVLISIPVTMKMHPPGLL